MVETASFGRYVLPRRIAAGGMAEVLVADFTGPEQFRKRVVIKRMHEHLARDERFVSMFVAEARLMAALSHPNLVQVYELDEIDGRLCIIMEYLEGKSLGAIIEQALARDEPIPAAIAAFILSQACQGADYAHDFRNPEGMPLNVVHRDLSPMNIVVTWRGDIRVVDFGIAKYAGTERTQTGVIKGTVRYMSPEQILQKHVDRRSDVWSLGVVLYELLTRSKLFERDDSNPLAAHQLLSIITNLTGVPTEVEAADIPEPLRQILRRALHANPDARYDSAGDMARDLEELLQSSGRILAIDVGEWLSTLFLGLRSELEAPPVGASLVAVGERLADPSEVLAAEQVGDLLAGTEPETVVGRPTPRSSDEEAAVRPTGSDPVFGETAPETNLPRFGATAELEPTEETAVSDDTRIESIAAGNARGRRSLVISALIVLVAAGAAGALLIGHRSSTPTPEMPPPAITATSPPPETSTLSPTATEPPVTGDTEMPTRQEESRAQAPADPPRRKGRRPGRKAKRPAAASAPQTGRLLLESRPVTSVSWSGGTLGKTPIDVAEFPAGRHTFTLINRKEHIRREVTLDVTGGKTTLHTVELDQGKLVFVVEGWADVYLGEEKLDRTPMPPRTMYEGSYEFTLVNPTSGVLRKVQAVVKAGETTRVRVDMR